MTSDDPTVTVNDIQDMLEMVQADREAKKVFLAMPREEQLLAILGMIAYLGNQIAKSQKESIEYRQTREKEERKRGDSLVNTGERIAEGIKKALGEREANKFDFWRYLLDKVVPGIIQFIILALLALIFAKDSLLALIGR